MLRTRNLSTSWNLSSEYASSPNAGAFSYGPNGGLYSSLGSTVLGSGGVPETLVLTFATAQNDVSLGFAIGDFFALDGGDAVWSGHALRALARHQLPGGQGSHCLPLGVRTNPASHTHGQASGAEPTAVNDACNGGLVHGEQRASLTAVHADARYWPVAHTPHGDGAVEPWTQK